MRMLCNDHETRTGGARRGAVMLVVLIPLMMVGMMGFTFLMLTNSVTRKQTQAQDQMRAFYMAEAGLAESFSALHVGRSGEVGSMEEPAKFGHGLFWVEREYLGEGRYSFESTGLVGRGRATLSIVVEKALFNYAAMGFFSSGELEVADGTLIDGYDSTAGTYGDQLAAGRTNVGRAVSNEDVKIDGVTTLVNGNAEAGLGADVEITGGATLTGSPGSTDESILPPEPEIPAITSLGDLVQDDIAAYVIPSSHVAYDSIRVEEGAELILRGPLVLRVEVIDIEENAILTFDTTDGPIEIYVTEEFDLDDGARAVTTSGSPRDVVVFAGSDGGGSDPEVELGEDVLLECAIYAPRSTVSLADGAELFGAIVADQLDIDKNVALHFDTAVASEGDLLSSFQGWRIVELASPVGQTDPFTALNVDGSTLVYPRDAHMAVWLEIKYYPDSVSGKILWEGDYDAFDWSLVWKLHHYKVYEAEGGSEILHVHP